MSYTVIEIDHPKNSPVSFLAIGTKLRSKRVAVRFGPGCPAYKHDSPEIPGQQIALDFKARKGQILDPIMSDENAALRERDIALMGQNDGHTYGYVDPDTKLPLKEKVSYPALSETEAAQWQYWMRRLLDSGHARLISGTEPPVLSDCRKALNGDLPCPNASGYPDDIYRTSDEIRERDRKEKLATVSA